MEIFQVDLAGKTLTLETGKVAKQAGGAVMVRYGDTALLATATLSAEPREGIDFFPLTVDYEERLYAVGRIPGGFIRREGRPSEKAILGARLTDRPLRPLFPADFRHAVHIVITVLSIDQDCVPEPLAIIGASAALSISSIPFDGPVAAVNVGLINGKPVISPDVHQTEQSTLNLIVAGTADAVMMVEAGAKEVSEEAILDAVLAGHAAIREIVNLQKQMQEKIGKKKIEVLPFVPDPEISRALELFADQKINNALHTGLKQDRESILNELKKEALEHFAKIYPEQLRDVSVALEGLIKKRMRQMILQEKIRPDGRDWREIRSISSEVQLFWRTHGSSLFTRGQTQIMNICTLGALRDMQILDGLGIEESKRFIHHYNFPPYSVGETGFMRGPGRREIGHGALAERALEPVIPSEDVFPYTIRLVSEVLESNGSTSMGSVCAGSLSLMDAGVPITKPVAGIAMGLIQDEDKVAILSDIQGMEDFLGDMDFKVAGTMDGITAMQMDTKLAGLSRQILKDAIVQAREGYMFILNKMLEAIKEPRQELSPHAPRIITIQIDPDKIRDVIGPGGKIINKIIAETGADINVENDGRIFIVAVDQEAGKRAQEYIETLVADVEPGRFYVGKVTRTERYGAFVEVLPGKEGLVHISHLDNYRVNATEDVVKVGDQVMVKVLDIDEKGRINLSRKEALTAKNPIPVEKRVNNDEDKEQLSSAKRNRRFPRRH